MEQEPRHSLAQKGCRPFLRWAGGKQKLLDAYAVHIPERLGRYFEPFLGGGSLFFSRAPAQATLSDVNGELINAYHIVRDSPDQLADLLEKFEDSAAVYYWVRDEYEPKQALDRAARFVFLNMTCWNGLYRENLAAQFNVPYGARKTPWRIDRNLLHRCSEALEDACIVRADFSRPLRYARDGDFVYLDPPYVTAHNNNGFIEYNSAIFSWSDQIRLAKLAKDMVSRGVKVLVSNAQHRPLVELYEGFEVIEIERSSTIAGSAHARRKTSEVLLKGGY